MGAYFNREEYIMLGDYKSSPGRIFVGVFAAICVNIGFIGVFSVNEIQADPVHVDVVSLIFLFISDFVFEFAGWWGMPKVSLTSVCVCVCMCVCVCVWEGGWEWGAAILLWDLVLGKEISYCDAVWS